jgi:REP element-mobilizing transposase RayT
MTRAYGISDQSRLHFVTFTIVDWIKVFEIEDHCKKFLESVRYCQENKGLEVYAWCIMPNHVHLIVGTSGKMKLENIIRDLKSYSSKQIHLALENRSEFNLGIEEHLIKTGTKNQKNKKFQLWQQPYHAVELSTNDIMDQRLEYIHNNPVNAGLVDEPESWTWSSAIDYYGGKGLLELLYIG